VKPRPTELLLACPRVSPEWELGALRALIKPQTRGRIAHRRGDQTWPANGDEQVKLVSAVIQERLGLHVEMHRPNAGDYLAAATIPAARQLEGLAFAAVISKAMPTVWFTYGRLHVLGGKFYRRERGVKLWLVEATNVHFPRELRAMLKGFI
jgi:hypothetical protein